MNFGDYKKRPILKTFLINKLTKSDGDKIEEKAFTITFAACFPFKLSLHSTQS